MHQAGLGVADRQVAVGAALVLVDLDVGRAVHRLQAHRAVLDVGEVHVLAVGVPVARLLEQVDVEEDRRLDLAVAALAVLAAPQLGQRVPDRDAARLPERAARRELREEEQLELAPELAVIARPGLLEQLLVRGEVLLGEERRPVDAREHRALGIPAPVGAGHRLQPEGLDRLSRRRVRPAAEVGERPVGVERDRLHAGVRDEIVDQLDLVVLLLGDEALTGHGDRDVLALERLGGLHVLAHARLDRREVGLRERDPLRELEVVVEAVLDRRADRDLHARVQLHHRRRQHVRRVVAHERERVVPALLGDDRDVRAVGQRARQVAHLAAVAGLGMAHPDGERRARESGTDRGRRVGAGGAVVERQGVAVGKVGGDRHGSGRLPARRTSTARRLPRRRDPAPIRRPTARGPSRRRARGR